MDWSYVFPLALVFTLLWIFIQRTEKKYKRYSYLVLILILLAVRYNAFLRDIHAESWLAFFIGLLGGFLFWLLIGRYNPVGSSDDIQVIGLDD